MRCRSGPRWLTVRRWRTHPTDRGHRAGHSPHRMHPSGRQISVELPARHLPRSGTSDRDGPSQAHHHPGAPADHDVRRARDARRKAAVRDDRTPEQPCSILLARRPRRHRCFSRDAPAAAGEALTDRRRVGRCRGVRLRAPAAPDLRAAERATCRGVVPRRSRHPADGGGAAAGRGLRGPARRPARHRPDRAAQDARRRPGTRPGGPAGSGPTPPSTTGIARVPLPPRPTREDG